MDIKELAPKVAKEMDAEYPRQDWTKALWDADFATRLIAAYHAEQEPVSLYPCGFKELNSLVIKNGAYLARGMYEGEPVTESIRSAAMVLIGYAKDMSILLAKQPLYAAPPEPAPKETALSKYKRLEVEHEITDPIERLRAFCSFAMVGQDWLDVEQFFGALTARVPDGCVVVSRADILHCLEYWNGSRNEHAMSDALDHIDQHLSKWIAAGEVKP